VIGLAPEQIAAEAGAQILARGPADGHHPERAVIDSRGAGPGDLFVGIAGARVDGGQFAAATLEAGAWGVLVDHRRAARLADGPWAGRAWILGCEDPVRALALLARGWRRRLGCPTVGVTGSTGKTSVKDICRVLLPRRTHVTPENYNTEIGLPLTILAAPEGTEILVLEMAMRGLGQIADLCEIAEPGVAAITNIGPVHLELLGTLEAVAEAKAEILAGLGPEGRAVIPADAETLEPHLHDALTTFTFGAGGDVFAERVERDSAGIKALIGTPHGEAVFEFPFDEEHNLQNALCAVAIGIALGFDPAEMAVRAPEVTFSRLRGERIELRSEIIVLNDCYNANPISMRAALEHLATLEAPRKLAALGGMGELGPDSAAYHEEVGVLARRLGIEPVIGVGELARGYGPDHWQHDAAAAGELVVKLLEPGDALLVKGSRSVGLELLTDIVAARVGSPE